MPRRKKQEVVTKSWLSANLPKMVAGIIATGAVGGTGLSYATGSSANERTAKLETKVERDEEDIEKLTDRLGKVDRRTVRIEEGVKMLLEKQGIKRSMGPDER